MDSLKEATSKAGRARWEGVSKKDRIAHSKKMNCARAKKRAEEKRLLSQIKSK